MVLLSMVFSPIYERQSSTLNPGTARKSESVETTVQLPSVIAIDAIIMSTMPIGRPRRANSVFDAGDQLCQYRNANADWIALGGFAACAFKDTVAPVDVMAGHVRVE
jgi:hypothetical protein